MKKRYYIFSLIAILVFCSISFTTNAFAFSQRYSEPTSSDSTWWCYSSPTNNYPISPLNGGNCTWYAYGRTLEVYGQGFGLGYLGNAGTWYNSAQNLGLTVSSTPRAGSIICWGGYSDGYGHVGFVEEVNGSTVTWTESSYQFYDGPERLRFRRYSSTHPWTYLGSDGYLQGYIYLDINDKTAPTISNVTITDITRDGYTVNCTVNDNLALSNVKFPTWTTTNGQDDITWGTVNVSGTSANISYRVNISDHNYEFGTYITHIYAYDIAGNQSPCAGTSANLFDYRDFLDEPTEGAGYVDKDLVIRGWSISMQDNIEAVKFSVNGCDWTDADRFDRIDVRNALPEYLDGNEGFTFTVDKNRLNNGNNTVVVKTVYTDGQERIIAIRNFTANHDYIPEEVFEYNGNIYCVYDDVMNWSAARDLCTNNGGHLVTIDNAEENEEITKHLNNKRYWIGLNDVDTEGNFVWCDGSESTYRNFSDGEPNNSAGNEDCCAIYGSGKWNDLADVDGDNAKVGFILEIEGKSIDLNSTKFLGNSMYEFYNNKMPYSAAEFYASLKGGHLVTITSAEENEFIKNNITAINWIGLTDTETEGEFKWITNEALDYTNWVNGEPNNFNGIEDYCSIGTSGGWNDIYNYAGYTYVIEYPADINLSGVNDNVDATMLLKHLSGIKSLTDEEYSRADVDGNDIVDMRDVIYILNIK